MRRAVFRSLGRGVYPGVLPLPSEACGGAERWLEDLWRDAPRRVALAHLAAALAVWALPPVRIGRFTSFPRLSRADQERMMVGMLASRWYLVRLVALVCKGGALVGMLRDPRARKALWGAEDPA